MNLEEICKNNGIIPKGVIHIGSDIENSYKEYMFLNIKKILFIEKDKDIYNSLKHITTDNPNVILINCIIHDKNHDPVKNTNQEVHRTVDQLLIDIKQSPLDYNIIVNNTQTCQDFIITGAQKYISKNCSLILNRFNILKDESTLLTKRYNFKTYKDPESNNNYYVSDQLIQVSTIGINGRFANQVFQHMFASCYAKTNNLKTEFPTWIGQQIFEISDNPITRTLPQLDIANNLPVQDLTNHDVIGWFQYHTSYYAPYKELIANLYKIKSKYQEYLDYELSKIFQNKRTIAIHLRLSDYGYDDFYITPIKYYINFLESFYNPDTDILYIASDDPSVYKQFSKYNPITYKDLNIVTQITYLIDFYVMTKVNLLAISNSSFSFLASMLNSLRGYNTSYSNIDYATLFYRPDFNQERLVIYDPWNDKVLYKLDTEKQKTNIRNQVKPVIRNLHIGGQEHNPNWEILNLENTKNTDHVGDATNLYKFEENSFDKIYASHILEHFDFIDLPKILKDWHRVLKQNGILYISVPNVRVIIDLFKRVGNNPQDQFGLMRMIFGGHIDKNDYHQMGFTFEILSMFLESAGFKNIKQVKEFNIFNDTSSMRYDKTLISLNVICEK